MDESLCGTSQLYVRLRNRCINWRYHPGSEGQIPPRIPGATIQQAALRQYRLNLELFVDCARNIGAVPVLMTQMRLPVPGPPSPAAQEIRYEYTQFDHELLCEAFAHTDRIIKEVAQRKDVAMIDASAQLSSRPELLRNHVHTTALGAEKLAELVAHEIRRLIEARRFDKRP
ncbi:MAG: hypothetical protein JXR37_12755 [Kiritimatiellae bacterium]|nr:hypothetical protein [Kiritimatiellia bacterium]